MCHTILHENSDHESCLEVAFSRPLEVSGVLFVLRIFFLFLVGLGFFSVWVFFFWRGVEASLVFLIEAISMTLPQFPI